MSILSSIRKSRESAREYNAKVAEQKKQGASSSAAYRHVPTHAAIDAVASAPPTWREADDRRKILEQHHKRSSMGPTAHGGFPRASSSLSSVSYSGAAHGTTGGVSRVVPRSYSYTGVSPYADGSRDVIYSIPDHVPHQEEYQVGGGGGPTMATRSSSQDDLELRHDHSAHHSNSGGNNGLLHPVRHGKGKGKHMPSSASSSTSSNRAVRVGTAPGPLPVTAMSAAAPPPAATAAAMVLTRNPSPDSTSSPSPPALTPTSAKFPSVITPAATAAAKDAGDVSYFSHLDPKLNLGTPPPHQPSKATRFAEPSPAASVEQIASVPGAVIVNMLPEPAEPAPEMQVLKRRRLSKLLRGR
ncbi:hypothetical protein GMORB2_0295 [Geosmithia morbida]|uniref:Uncharacterized protein n=1 Tax=Geosmithia morbida TaxID=1094350 RepID=A0A9P5D9I3_9HYPO|nr:uncharacterized protein GMORB2_0295 [Geosmithia morbida]KAF4126559.1 hypothetical protein GMORB2_0295 [Geosmithia morbida]